jgi:hypothetical protein
MEDDVVRLVDDIADLVSRLLDVIETVVDDDRDSFAEDVIDCVDNGVTDVDELDVSDFEDVLLPLTVFLDVDVLETELDRVDVLETELDFEREAVEEIVRLFRDVPDKPAEDDMLYEFTGLLEEDDDDETDLESRDDREPVDDADAVFVDHLDGVDDKLEDALFDALNDGVPLPVALELLEGRSDKDTVDDVVDDRDDLEDKEIEGDVDEERDTEEEGVPVRVPVIDLEG